MIKNNEKSSRFELEVDGRTAFANYELRPDTIVLMHTEVPKELGGRGIGGQLAEFALQHARANDLRVIPMCPFMASYIDKHPEYRDLVRT